MKKYEIYRAERKKGLSYQEIADKYGVTRQNVGLACSVCQPFKFVRVSEKGCIYPNFRKWMNENQITPKELLHRMGLVYHSANLQRLRKYLTGSEGTPKRVIDKFIKITGLSYETLFETDTRGAI